MTDSHSIPKTVFNAAVQAAIPAVRTPLLALEAAVAAMELDSADPAVTNLAAVHAALSAVLATCDSLGSAGGIHTDTGGGNKGTSS